MKKTLIAGGAGYIGTHTVRYFIEAGVKPSDIVVFDNLINGNRNLLPDNVTFVKGDLLNKSVIEQVFKTYSIENVIHFAAYAYVGESLQNPGKYFENNVLGGLNLLNAMRGGDCFEIIFSSTCSTYGIPETLPIKEDTVQKPVNPYGESKLMFERILSWYAVIYGIRSINLRYFNAAGAGYGIGECHNPETHLIPLVIRAAISGEPVLNVFGTDYDTADGTCVRDYIHVKDLAAAHYKALGRLAQSKQLTESFNLGTGKGASVRDVIKYVEMVSGLKVPYVEKARRLGDPAVLVADAAKAGEYLNWTPMFNLENIIKDAWEWHNREAKK